MRKLLAALSLLGAALLVAFWALTRPQVISATELPDRDGDPAKGEYVFHAAGCGSCHAAPGAKGEDKLKLAGGQAFKTPFGTFYAPNISSDPTHGIGGWTPAQFATAVMRGVSPEESHYYPAFPYASYQHMTISDVLDLKAFMDTLPAVSGEAADHELPLPLRWRRGTGIWKWLFMDQALPAPSPSASELETRGAYLVNGPSHCGECHTPRNFLGGPKLDEAFSGGPEPDGEGTIPNITPHEDGIGDWSTKDIVAALKTGILPDFETFGGSMIPVQENMAKLSARDREAIAAYLKSLPPKQSLWKKAKSGTP